jgi:F0F1-type ATP synthase epsilon subunit
VVVRSPETVVFDKEVDALRVPTETGQVGIRHGAEPIVFIVEAGLLLARIGATTHFIGCAGGILDSTREQVNILTPFAIVHTSADTVLKELNERMTTPDAELIARRHLGELEMRIASELRRRAQSSANVGEL